MIVSRLPAIPSVDSEPHEEQTLEHQSITEAFVKRLTHLTKIQVTKVLESIAGGEIINDITRLIPELGQETSLHTKEDLRNFAHRLGVPISQDGVETAVRAYFLEANYKADVLSFRPQRR